MVLPPTTGGLLAQENRYGQAIQKKWHPAGLYNRWKSL